MALQLKLIALEHFYQDLVDVRPVRDSSHIEGKELEFKVIKMDLKRNNIVVSRRAVVEQESSADRQALLSSLHDGQI